MEHWLNDRFKYLGEKEIQAIQDSAFCWLILFCKIPNLDCPGIVIETFNPIAFRKAKIAILAFLSAGLKPQKAWQNFKKKNVQAISYWEFKG